MKNELFTDTPTEKRVTTYGRRHVVFARHDWQGNFVRYVVHLSKAEQEHVRARYYRGVTVVNMMTWAEVHPHELE